VHLLGRGGSSAGLVGVLPLAGYACMWVMGGKAPAYVYARPSERSATVGVGGEMVIATSPLHLVGGFGESCAAMAAMDGLPQGLFVPTRIREVWAELHAVGTIRCELAFTRSVDRTGSQRLS